MDLKLKETKKGHDCLPDKTINNVEYERKLHLIELLPTENKCIHCDKKFNFRQDLSNHVQLLHSHAKAFKCGDCNLLLTNMICLSHHMEKHKESLKKYVCEFCSMEFIYSDELKSHLKLHTEESPKSSNDMSMKKHVCDHCSKSFDRIFNLKRHLRVHTGERPFPCKLCKKAYKEKCDLTNHQKFHILEKKLNGVLKGRLRTRAGKRPYACSLCEKRYKEMRHLTRHQKTHEDETSEESENDLNCSKVNTRTRSSTNRSSVNKSSKNRVDQIIKKLDIKEELYSDSDSFDDLEVKNLIEICKTEYIYDEEIACSAERLEEESNA